MLKCELISFEKGDTIELESKAAQQSKIQSFILKKNLNRS